MKTKLFYAVLVMSFFQSFLFASDFKSEWIKKEKTMLSPSDSIKSKRPSDSLKSIRPFRIGVKIGFPHLIGGSVEYVTPLLGNRVAPFIDYSTLSPKIEDVDMKIKYLEIGSNFYFNRKGKAVYAGLSYGKIDYAGDYSGEQNYEGKNFTGKAHGELNLSVFNVKLGAKLGNTIYFRPELGYGFTTIPDQIRVDGIVDGQASYGYVDIPEDIPGISSNGFLYVNFGFGVAF